MACIFFSISSGKLDFVKKLPKTRAGSHLTIPSSNDPEQTIGEEIRRQIKSIAVFVLEIKPFPNE